MGIKTPSETRAIIEGRGREPYHPINDKENMRRYEKYRELAAAGGNVTSGGRQGKYKYYDMDKVIESALKRAKEFGVG